MIESTMRCADNCCYLVRCCDIDKKNIIGTLFGQADVSSFCILLLSLIILFADTTHPTLCDILNIPAIFTTNLNWRR